MQNKNKKTQDYLIDVCPEHLGKDSAIQIAQKKA